MPAAETVPIAETGFTAAAAAAAAGPLVSVPVQQVARAEGFWRHRGLIAFSAGCAMAEAVVLTVFAPAAKSLAPQVTALPPLAVYHDLRWLFGYNRSWLEFAAGVLILVLGRSAVNTTMVQLSWPRDLRAPRPALTFAASMAFTLVAGILMVPIATLVFGVAVLPFSWPFLAAVPVLLALALAATATAASCPGGGGGCRRCARPAGLSPVSSSTRCSRWRSRGCPRPGS